MSPILKTRAVALTLCALALAAGCSKGTRRSLSAAMELRQKLVQEYDHQHVFVNLQDGAALAVTFVNSRFNESDRPARARAAQEIAEFTRTHFVGAERLRHIAVSFDAGETSYGIFNTRRSLDHFVFDPRHIADGDIRERDADGGP